MVIIPSRISMLPRASPRRSVGQPDVEWTARHKFASFPKCGRTRPSLRRPAEITWNSPQLPRRRLPRRGLAGSPRRRAFEAQSQHSREPPRCAFESECGTCRGATRSTGRLVHRRHEVDAKTLRHGAVALLVC